MAFSNLSLTDAPILPDTITLGTAALSYSTQFWELLDTVDIYLQGFDKSTDPSPAIADWLKTNQAAIA
jgi:hypothetical protein